LVAFIEDSETDVLSHLDFPEQHRAKVHSTNPLERLNKMGYPGRRAFGGFLAAIA